MPCVNDLGRDLLPCLDLLSVVVLVRAALADCFCPTAKFLFIVQLRAAAIEKRDTLILIFSRVAQLRNFLDG